MGVRFLVVWTVVGLALGACGDTSNNPKLMPGEQPTCGADECPTACEASARFCFKSQIWKCSADGKSARLVENCADGEACQETDASAACEKQCQGADCEPAPVCMPHLRECRDGDVYECDADGAELIVYDDCDETRLEVCDPATLACVSTCPGAPACPEPSCKPGEKRCVANDVHICNETGSTLVFSQACGYNARCIDGPPTYCRQNSCAPGSMVCDGNVLKRCNDDGSLPDDGSDCSDQICDGASCKPKFCEPLEYICIDGDVRQCGTLGTTTFHVETCLESAPCTEIAPNVLQCRALPCEAGATVCLGNAFGTCATDGQSLSQVTTNCAASNQVCNATPACAASAVDAAGVAEEVEGLGPNYFYGNVIDVSSNRLLTKLEVNLLLEAPRDLRFVVYEKKAQDFEVVCSEITANNLGSAFFGTTALSCALEAGKRYAVGVALVVGEGYHYSDAEPHRGALSFGTALGSTSNGYSATVSFDVSASTLYQQRLTTELP
ncbi:MAG TPA: hypothetical protein VJN18_08075 [Polyangiaceae bacterium]|nr:hypothetical protein [Polyangiaceae bacterium]